MKEQFRKIIVEKNKTEIIPFLKQLTDKQKKELIPVLKEYNEGGLLSDPEDKKSILFLANLVCCTQSQFEKSYIRHYNRIILGALLEELLNWYSPLWFNDVVNNRNYGFNYLKLIEFTDKGYLIPSQKIIAFSLSGANYNSEKLPDNKGWIHTGTMENLFQYPVTLQEHIWYLFQNEYHIIYREDMDFIHKKREDDRSWTGVFQRLTEENHIDRLRVLKEAILASNRGFSKEASSWFISLSVTLKPTEEELIAVQGELFEALLSSNSKVINTVLNFFKKIVSDKRFYQERFIEQAGLLFSSEIKSILLSTIMIAEKIAKHNKNIRETICTLLCLVFINKDETVQTKAAKVISIYGNPDSKALQGALLPYKELILMGVKGLLQNYLEKDTVFVTDLTEEEVVEKRLLICKDNSIESIKTIEDLIFFLSRVFDTNTPCDIDLLPEAVIRLHSQITADTLNQFEIAFQKAYPVSTRKAFWNSRSEVIDKKENYFVWNTGLYEHLLAVFFIDYGRILCKEYPEDTLFITQLHKAALQIKGDRFNTTPLTSLKNWIGQEYKIYYPYHQILLKAISLIEEETELPLLSTPTHVPAWINPVVLVQRIQQYQLAGVEPDTMDLQLAFLRCALDNVQEAVVLVEKELKGEYKALFLYLFGTINEMYPEKYNVWWNTVKRIRFGLFQNQASFLWKIADERLIDGYGTERVQLVIEMFEIEEELSIFTFAYENLRLSVGPCDIKYLILTYPNLPEIIFAHFIQDRLSIAQVADAETRDLLLTAVATLQELNIPLADMTSLFLACCMLSSEKTVRNYAAEIWTEKISYNQLDNKAFGISIGRLEKEEWAPLKRFTDLITGNLIGISAKHNQAIEDMITEILFHLDEKPIKDLKKMLEIYKEVLALNNSKVATKVIPQLEIWRQNVNLKKAVNYLI